MWDAVWIAVNGGPIGWFIEKLEVTYPAAGMHCSAQMTGSEKERQLERSVFWEPLKNQPSWVWDDPNLETITFIIFGSCLILISRYISIKQACELWTEHHAAKLYWKIFETLTLLYGIPTKKNTDSPALKFAPVLKLPYDTSWQLLHVSTKVGRVTHNTVTSGLQMVETSGYRWKLHGIAEPACVEKMKMKSGDTGKTRMELERFLMSYICEWFW